MGIRNNFVKWIAIVLLAGSLGLMGLAVLSRNAVRGKSKQATSQHVQVPAATREPTPLPTHTCKTTATVHGYEMHTYTDVDGMKMTYYLYVPSCYTAQQKYPLVLLLHGGGESANPKATPEQNSALLLNQYYAHVWTSSAIQQKWPSFIVIPQVVSPKRWVNVPAAAGSYTLAAQPSDSLRLAKEIVDMLQHEYQGIDAHRLYVTGLSMGGYGTWEAIERWPDYFAAAAPLAGAGDPSKAAALVHIPIWAFHGAQDTDVPVSGSRDMIQAIIQAGGHPRYTEYPKDGHDLWGSGKVYSPTSNPALFTWLFSQKQTVGLEVLHAEFR
jgi:predicted peptidase